MIMIPTVFKEVHNTWPAKNGKPAGESYDLLCMDISNPTAHWPERITGAKHALGQMRTS